MIASFIAPQVDCACACSNERPQHKCALVKCVALAVRSTARIVFSYVVFCRTGAQLGLIAREQSVSERDEESESRDRDTGTETEAVRATITVQYINNNK